MPCNLGECVRFKNCIYLRNVYTCQQVDFPFELIRLFLNLFRHQKR